MNAKWHNLCEQEKEWRRQNFLKTHNPPPKKVNHGLVPYFIKQRGEEWTKKNHPEAYAKYKAVV